MLYILYMPYLAAGLVSCTLQAHVVHFIQAVRPIYKAAVRLHSACVCLHGLQEGVLLEEPQAPEDLGKANLRKQQNSKTAKQQIRL